MNMKFTAVPVLAFLLLNACETSRKSTQTVAATSSFPPFGKEGHRGSRGLMPENTIPAMFKAIDLGVTTLEMDVVISKDKKVVVSHDPYFNADITTTPEGTHLTKQEGSKRLLYTMNYDSIRKYDVGLRPHPSFPRQQKLAAYKPLVSELIKATEEYTKEKGAPSLWYNIETKCKAGGEGKSHPAPEEFVDLLVKEITNAGIASRTVIQSFDIRTLQVVYKKYPQIKTSLLIEPTDKRSVEEQLKELGYIPFIYSPHYSLVTPDRVKVCHDKGLKVIPWTLNSREDIEKAKAAGVDGIISDYPDLFN